MSWDDGGSHSLSKQDHVSWIYRNYIRKKRYINYVTLVPWQ